MSEIIIASGKVITKNCPDRTIKVFLNTLKDWLEKLEGKKVTLKLLVED